MNEQVTAALC